VALNADTIFEDVRAQALPVWRLSCYGPARNEPNLKDGDYSPEEMRWNALQALKESKGAEYVSMGRSVRGGTRRSLRLARRF
jgi:hypothetical protein